MRGLKTIYALLLGPIVLAVLLICARLIHGSWSSEGFAYSLLVGVCGVVVGWIVGLVASPYRRDEKKKFSSLATGMIGFLTGYAGTKILDPIMKHLFDEGAIFSEPVLGANVLIFVSRLVVSSINGYAYRSYLHPGDRTSNATEDK